MSSAAYCLKETYFSVSREFSSQINKTAMVVAVSITAANLTVEQYTEKRWHLHSFNDKPKVFVKYTDDCFCITTKSALDNFLVHLCSQ